MILLSEQISCQWCTNVDWNHRYLWNITGCMPFLGFGAREGRLLGIGAKGLVTWNWTRDFVKQAGAYAWHPGQRMCKWELRKFQLAYDKQGVWHVLLSLHVVFYALCRRWSLPSARVAKRFYKMQERL